MRAIAALAQAPRPARELAAHWYSKGGKVRKFDRGGVINEPVFGWGARSGQRYSFGERGRETVTPGGGGTPVFNITINAPSGNARDIGRTIVEYIRAYVMGGGTLLPTGVRH